MDKQEEILKKDYLIKKYSNKPIPKFLKFIGKIREIDQYESWIKETTKALLNFFIDYLVILPFVIFFCLSAFGFSTSLMLNFFLAEGSSLFWFLLLSLIKDMRGAYKNG